MIFIESYSIVQILCISAAALYFKIMILFFKFKKLENQEIFKKRFQKIILAPKKTQNGYCATSFENFLISSMLADLETVYFSGPISKSM